MLHFPVLHIPPSTFSHGNKEHALVANPAEERFENQHTTAKMSLWPRNQKELS
jgi:hypothetical protein